jgi:Uma2 family endonuclease
MNNKHLLSDYLKSINETKQNLLDSEDSSWEKEYPAWVITKCMASHYDTVLLANEMNIYYELQNKLQYDFYINTVRKRKRFSPWEKKVKIEDLETVKTYYNYSTQKAQAILKILNKDQLDHLKSKLNRGGKNVPSS